LRIALDNLYCLLRIIYQWFYYSFILLPTIVHHYCYIILYNFLEPVRSPRQRRVRVYAVNSEGQKTAFEGERWVLGCASRRRGVWVPLVAERAAEVDRSGPAVLDTYIFCTTVVPENYSSPPPLIIIIIIIITVAIVPRRF